MSSSHDPTKQNAIDMTNARAATSIEVADVRKFLNGGPLLWDRRKKIVTILSNDPVFDKSLRAFHSRQEQFLRGEAISNRLYELQELHKWSQEDMTIALSVMDEPLPIASHNITFKPVLELQASTELRSKYAAMTASKGILGCYLQTELGHGSNLSCLETTATYLPQTQEFELHSPTLTSTKWWSGALGKTATHGIIQAKLILPGEKDMGPHLFFVQLRSLETHETLPGRTLGDVGQPDTLCGWASTDNGFARFDHVRIPKENMLSKFAGVSDAGEYVTPPHAKMSFSGLIYFRSLMVTNAGWLIAKAATVSIRYATVRRQGEIGPDGLERQIITYPSVHVRIIPLLARAFVYLELGRALTRRVDELTRDLSVGDTTQLAELHHMVSGLKVLVSTTGIQDLETARRSMGGHGYSAFAGLGKLYADFLPAATYEGENSILEQQVVRAALKTFRSLSTPRPASLSGTSSYLCLIRDKALVPPKATADTWAKPEAAISLLEWRASLLVQEMANTTTTPDPSITQRVSRAITEAFVAARVGELIAALDSAFKPRAVAVVRKVYLLYLLTTLESALVDLLSLGLIIATVETATHNPTRGLRLAVARLCKELLPEAIGLSDAFGFSDWELDSALGVYDGRVYEALWAKAQQEPLNRTDVTEAYEVSIKPLLLRGQKIAGAKL
ncbi:acyl-coenzyme A oxidase [Favolaschia claudopus]|uniref:Acyl-coenzyme A oxidase n=1 Tax=Favolaschia claudopus TaxID=2862362 RepID=A0AAW0ALV4_9AGAR